MAYYFNHYLDIMIVENEQDIMTGLSAVRKSYPWVSTYCVVLRSLLQSVLAAIHSPTSVFSNSEDPSHANDEAEVDDYSLRMRVNLRLLLTVLFKCSFHKLNIKNTP